MLTFCPHPETPQRESGGVTPGRSLRIPQEIMDRVDRERGGYITRSAMIKTLLDEALRAREAKRAARRT